MAYTMEDLERDYFRRAIPKFLEKPEFRKMLIENILPNMSVEERLAGEYLAGFSADQIRAILARYVSGHQDS